MVMKKLALIISGIVFSTSLFAQQVDSANTEGNFDQSPARQPSVNFQYPSISQPTDSPSMKSTPQQTSPIIQQRYQVQPKLQSLPQQQQWQPQPGLRLQPLQTNPQIPSQSEPLDFNNSNQQNQLSPQAQPTQTPSTPND